jgi:hypothetical protein
MQSMIYKILLGSALFTGSLCAPAPSASQIASLQTQAHGTLPNGKITLTQGSVGPDGITNVQLLNFNENFEVAFFTSLVNNITQSVPGFTLDDEGEKKGVLDIMHTILAVSALLSPPTALSALINTDIARATSRPQRFVSSSKSKPVRH